jgi:hypothetical protein
MLLEESNGGIKLKYLKDTIQTILYFKTALPLAADVMMDERGV